MITVTKVINMDIFRFTSLGLY